eukprot:scaffold13987_cov132-Cylindrotheca_fusiformis.AAC.1
MLKYPTMDNMDIGPGLPNRRPLDRRSSSSDGPPKIPSRQHSIRKQNRNIMEDEKDWECISDFETEHVDPPIRVELPAGGIPSKTMGVTQSPLESVSSSLNSFSIVEKDGELFARSRAGSSISSQYVNVTPNACDQSIGSVISSFEVISLPSGEEFLICNRCSSQHPVGTGICNICYLALCANPFPGMDEQLALALQLQGDENSQRGLEWREQRPLRLSGESLFDQARYLSDDIFSNLSGWDLLQFRPLPKIDMLFRCIDFIAYATEKIPNPYVSIAYKITSRSEWDTVRLSGFGGDTTVPVGMSIGGAIRLMEQELMFPNRSKNSSPHDTVLDSIPEDDSIQDSVNLLWVLVVVQSTASLVVEEVSDGMLLVESGNQLLPIACLDTEENNDGTEENNERNEVIGQFAHGLLRVCGFSLRDGLKEADVEPETITSEEAATVSGSSDDLHPDYIEDFGDIEEAAKVAMALAPAPSMLSQNRPPSVQTSAPKQKVSPVAATPKETRRQVEKAPSTAPSIMVGAKKEAKAEKKQAPSSAGKNSRGLFNPIRTGLIKRFNPDATECTLQDNEEKPYYDKDLKVWVFPGEDPADVAKPIAPPPIIISKAPEAAPATEPSKDAAAANDPLAAMMAPPTRQPVALRRPGGPSASKPTTGAAGYPGMMMPPMMGKSPATGGGAAPPQFAVFTPTAEKEEKKAD